MLEPRSTSAASSGSPLRAASSATMPMVASTRAGSASSRTISTQLLSDPKWSLGLDLVVEAQHRGRGASPQHAPADLECPRRSRSKPQAPLSLGRGERDGSASVASVMTPSVPSEPTKSCVRSGPTAARGPTPPVVDQAAVGERRRGGRGPCPRSCRSGSSTGPLLGRQASRRPWRSRRTGASGRACSPRRWRAARLRARVRRPRPRPGRSARSRRPPRIRSKPVRSSETPPLSGTAPPQTPLRPAAGVTGTAASAQAARTAATSSVDCGRTTTAGIPPTRSSSAQPTPSGHQSRPCAVRSASSVESAAPVERSRSRKASSRPAASDPKRAAARRRPGSSEGIVGSVIGAPAAAR